MPDKQSIEKDITYNKNFKTKIAEPFNKLSLNFISDFSQELRKFKKISLYPDLIYLIFWCSKYKKKITENNEKYLRMGRGLVFHICPSNVPTNFIYSFFFGLLSGNSNIVKIPSKDFKEKEIILSAIKSLFKRRKYLALKNSNTFITYDITTDKTKKISSICDARVIWGGNKTINEIRKIWIPERSIDITFPDRYSLSIINVKKFEKESPKEMEKLVKKFYYDGYTMNQLACNSPHFIFWIGKKNKEAQNKFWNCLNKIVKTKFVFDHVHVVDKYTNLLENIINEKNFNNIKMFKNNLYVVTPDKKTKKIENIRGINGTFFQKNIKNLNSLKEFISKKCQTVSYFGFDKYELKDFLKKNNLTGIDRMVPMGSALEIDIVWDGYDLIKSLSRAISVE